MITKEEAKEMFLEESKEHLESLKPILLELKALLPASDKQKVYSVYRAAHSIKGTASFLAFQNITKLAKAMESVMGKVRDGEKNLSESDFDTMINCAEKMETMIDEIDESEDLNIEEYLEVLHNLSS